MTPSAMNEEDAEEYFVDLLNGERLLAERIGQGSIPAKTAMTAQDRNMPGVAFLKDDGVVAASKHQPTYGHCSRGAGAGWRHIDVR